MNEIDAALRYIFIISLVLVLVAYWAGTRGVADVLGKNINMLILTVTGRDSSGKFAAYPTGGPTNTLPF